MEQSHKEIIRKLLKDKDLRQLASDLAKSNRHIIQDEDDIIQYGLQILWERLSSGEVINAPKRFVGKVMRNKSNQTDKRDRIRKEKNEKLDVSNSIGSSSEDHYLKKEELDIALNEINKLGEPCRRILHLYIIEQWKQQDIAKAFPSEKDTGWVKRNLYKCRLKLMKILMELPEFKDRFNGRK